MRSRPRPPRWPHILTLTCGALAACATYEAQPLGAMEAVALAAEAREAVQLPDGAEAVTMEVAVRWMVAGNPDLRRALAAFEAAAGNADVDTPLPDPQIQVGPRYGFGSDVTTSLWSGFLQSAFTIPTGDRRAVNDALEEARAEGARTAWILEFRGRVLDLRAGLARLVLSRARLTELEGLAEAAERGAALVRRGQRAGTTTALDVALAELEAARARAAVLGAREQELEATHAVAALTGVPADRFARLSPDLAPVLPDGPPPGEALRPLLARHHPELVRRRAEYVVAEHELHLQVELSRPDLQIAPSYTGENGDDIHVLQLGFQFSLPVFDGNVKGIRAAEERREELRAGYAAAASELLAELDASAAGVHMARERVRGLREDLLPIADRSAELVGRAMEAGSTDALRVLAVERAARELRAEALAAELHLAERWARLERAVGAPLLDLGGMGRGDWPRAHETDQPPPRDEDAARAAFGPFEDTDQESER